MHYSYISPLTWPGGKFNALGQIIPRIPKFQEFREPFAGSASVFFELQCRYPKRKFWINDLNVDLFNFYPLAKSDGARITGDILQLKQSFDEGQELLNYVITLPDTKYNRALKFFVLNRISYYGIGVSRQHTESKSFSIFKYQRKFTESLINRVARCEQLLKDVKITNHSYETLLKSKGNKVLSKGEDVFIFLDPPYKQKCNDLYGKRGSLHKNFNYLELSENLQACEHKFLMTINDKPEFRDLFSWARVEKVEVIYTMGSWKKGKELYISNYRQNNSKNVDLLSFGLQGDT